MSNSASLRSPYYSSSQLLRAQSSAKEPTIRTFMFRMPCSLFSSSPLSPPMSLIRGDTFTKSWPFTCSMSVPGNSTPSLHHQRLLSHLSRARTALFCTYQFPLPKPLSVPQSRPGSQANTSTSNPGITLNFPDHHSPSLRYRQFCLMRRKRRRSIEAILSHRWSL